MGCVDLHHIGDSLCAALLNQWVASKVALDGYEWTGDWTRKPLVDCGVALDSGAPWRFASGLPIAAEGERFDGMHRVDVGGVRGTEAIAFEAKLGVTRNGPQGVSHLLLGGDEGRWGVPQILQYRRARRDGPEVALCVRADGRLIPLRGGWSVIIRREVFDGWRRNGTPAFLRHPLVVVFEELGLCVGRETFNRIVGAVIGKPDYYREWVDQSADVDWSKLL